MHKTADIGNASEELRSSSDGSFLEACVGSVLTSLAQGGGSRKSDNLREYELTRGRVEPVDLDLEAQYAQFNVEFNVGEIVLVERSLAYAQETGRRHSYGIVISNNCAHQLKDWTNHELQKWLVHIGVGGAAMQSITGSALLQALDVPKEEALAALSEIGLSTLHAHEFLLQFQKLLLPAKDHRSHQAFRESQCAELLVRRLKRFNFDHSAAEELVELARARPLQGGDQSGLEVI